MGQKNKIKKDDIGVNDLPLFVKYSNNINTSSDETENNNIIYLSTKSEERQLNEKTTIKKSIIKSLLEHANQLNW